MQHLVLQQVEEKLILISEALNLEKREIVQPLRGGTRLWQCVEYLALHAHVSSTTPS